MTALDRPAPAGPEPSGVAPAASLPLPAPAARAAPERRLAARVLRLGATMAAVLAGGAALTVLFDAISTRFVPGNSDGATVVLEGAAVSGGNLALHGWAISLDSFWTLDVLLYALAVRIGGVHPDLMNLVPAILAASAVVLAAALAREGRRGLPAIAAIGAVILLLALPSPDLAYFLLQGPWHVGTTIAALGAFALLARPGGGWRWIAGVVILAAGLLGDVMILTFGLLPLVGCGLVAMARTRSWRAGVWSLAAAPASAALALGMRMVAQVVGTFTLANRNVPIRAHQLAENVGNLVNRFPGLLGVGTIPQTVPAGAGGFQAARVAGLDVELAAVAVGVVALVLGAWRGRAPEGAAGPWRLDDVLVLGVGSDLVTFVSAAGSNNTTYAKYLTPSVVLGAVLAGRYAGRLAARAPLRSRGLGVAFGCGAALAIVFLAQVGVELSAPDAVQPAMRLSTWLSAHHLDHGVGDYWSSTVVTVDSGGTVAVRPVTVNGRGTLRRYDRQSPVSWYAGQRFDFLVWDTAHPWRNVNASTAVATWGAPAHAYGVGSYQVLVWSKPFTVSTQLPGYGSPLQIFWSPGPPHGLRPAAPRHKAAPPPGRTTR